MPDLVMTNIAMEAMALIEIDHFPMTKPPFILGMFHGELLVITRWYKAGPPNDSVQLVHLTPMSLWFMKRK